VRSTTPLAGKVAQCSDCKRSQSFGTNNNNSPKTRLGSIQPNPFTCVGVPRLLVRVFGDAADYRTDQGTEAADDHPDDDLAAHRQAEHLTKAELANRRPDRPASPPPTMKIASLWSRTS
jgi:hypothetical protein